MKTMAAHANKDAPQYDDKIHFRLSASACQFGREFHYAKARNICLSRSKLFHEASLLDVLLPWL
jgi:hypothetical protein